jgi:hypothetical protein
MKIHIEPTTKIVYLNGVQTRVWEGETDGGLPVHAFIARVAADCEADNTELVEALQECRVPSPEVAAYPLRLVL